VIDPLNALKKLATTYYTHESTVHIKRINITLYIDPQILRAYLDNQIQPSHPLPSLPTPTPPEPPPPTPPAPPPSPHKNYT